MGTNVFKTSIVLGMLLLCSCQDAQIPKPLVTKPLPTIQPTSLPSVTITPTPLLSLSPSILPRPSATPDVVKPLPSATLLPTPTPMPTPTPSKTPIAKVTTYSGAPGHANIVDGPTSKAQFQLPNCLAIDATGILYVGDESVIRKIQRDDVTTFAGKSEFKKIEKLDGSRLYQGIPGFKDGKGSEAQFSNIADMVIAPDGNLYVTDSQTIRKVTPEGEVTTLAGTPQIKGYQDGAGNLAKFSDPWGIAVDRSGNLYVADSTNQRIRKITPEGVVSTVAGREGGSVKTDGPVAIAQFDYPRDVSLDPQENIYVGDYGSIRKISTDGMVTTLAGNGEIGYRDGKGSEVRMDHPSLVYAPNGIIYIGDNDNNIIRQLTPDGTVTTIAGQQGRCRDIMFDSACAEDGIGTKATFWNPSDIKVAKDGTLYIADYRTHTIRKITFE